MKKTFAPLLLAAFIIGCATGTHIVTGPARPAIKDWQTVTVYQAPPAKYQVIGIVNAQAPGNHQWNMNSAVKALKKQAAKIGANGIILGSVNPGSQSIGTGIGSGYGGGMTFNSSTIAISQTSIQLSGEAIYVEQ